MNDKQGPDPRKIHIGPVPSHREDNSENVVHLPTEIIDHKVEPTWLFDRIEPPRTNPNGPKNRVKEVVNKCQTALVRKKTTKINGDEKVESNGTKRDASERHTMSADLMRHREIREKCYTIREVSVTATTVFACINLAIFMIWLQFLLYSWSR